MTLQKTTNQIPLPEIPQAFEQALWQRLQNQAVIKEYDLLKHLTEQGFSQFAPSLEPLELFRAHFLLFHLLYRLQDKWAQEGKGQLFIHSLEISINPPNKDLLPSKKSEAKLKAYYLDYGEFLNTQTEDVLQLMDEFWQAFAQQGFDISVSDEEIEQAKQKLQIEQIEFDKSLVKQQFKKLSQQQHPDKGGDKESFQELCNARETLLNAIKSKEKITTY